MVDTFRNAWDACCIFATSPPFPHHTTPTERIAAALPVPAMMQIHNVFCILTYCSLGVSRSAGTEITPFEPDPGCTGVGNATDKQAICLSRRPNRRFSL